MKIELNAAQRLVEAGGPKIFQLKIKNLPMADHLKKHYATLLKKFPELLKGESIPVFKSGVPGREKYTVTNEKGTDTPWNDDTSTGFIFSKDEVKSTFELSE